MKAFIAKILLLPLLAILAHYLLFSGIERPPTDHGQGFMFDLIASRYDRINRILAMGMDLGWRRSMVREIKDSIRSNQHSSSSSSSTTNNNHDDDVRILDVSTGTGDVALLLASEIPNAFILGIDPSTRMLGVAKTKVTERNVQNQVNLQVLDARDLRDLPESSFHAATMAFGIRNIPERNVALCQIHRLLKNNSRFCILEFSEPDGAFGVLGFTARYFIRYVIPFLGGILSGAPREYWHLQNSIKHFPSPQQFSIEIESLQCSDGEFVVEAINQLAFGSVQIYIITAKKKSNSLEDAVAS